jgi:hypothetical protein
LLCWYKLNAGDAFLLAGLSLNVEKSNPGLAICAMDDDVTTREIPSGDDLAVAINTGRSNFVK